MGSTHRDEETIELALTMLALAGDSPTKAVGMLRDAGVRVSRDAITTWRNKNPERYAKIRDDRAHEIERSVVHRSRALANRYCDIEDQLIDVIEQEITDGKLKEASTTLRNIAVSKGIAIDKLLIIDGRPNTITEHRTPDDILRGLATKGYVTYTDSTAEETTPPEPPPATETNPQQKPREETQELAGRPLLAASAA